MFKSGRFLMWPVSVLGFVEKMNKIIQITEQHRKTGDFHRSGANKGSKSGGKKGPVGLEERLVAFYRARWWEAERGRKGGEPS